MATRVPSGDGDNPHNSDGIRTAAGGSTGTAQIDPSSNRRTNRDSSGVAPMPTTSRSATATGRVGNDGPAGGDARPPITSAGRATPTTPPAVPLYAA